MISETMDTVVQTQFNKKPLYIFTDNDEYHMPALSSTFSSCRICLEVCPNIQFCQCFGGMLCHELCLIQYIEKINEIDQGRVHKCQICKQIYRLQYEVKCTIKPKEMCGRIREAKTKCIVYALFFGLVFAYYISFGILYSSHEILQQLEPIIYVIGVCITILFFLFIFIWLYQFGMSNKKRLTKILTYEEQQALVRGRRKSTSKRKTSMASVTPCDNSTIGLN